MKKRRADDITEMLTENTVLDEWFSPMKMAFEKVRFSDQIFQSLPMISFTLFGALRQLTQTKSLREQVQALWHSDESAECVPMPRSTWSDALSSSTRRDILRCGVENLVKAARDILPDKFAGVEGLGDRPVLAIDATYQTESSHYRRVLPTEGGNDNQKGHMAITAYDMRLGIPVFVHTETASMGEIKVLKEVGANAKEDWTRVRHAVYVVDRAFIDARYWEERKKNVKATVVTRMKSKLSFEIKTARSISDSACNEQVLKDYDIKLRSGAEGWRLIEWRSPEGVTYQYLTNDLSMEPGVIAFLYYRRWDVEKYFDNFKNDLVNAKAWGKSPVAIEQQALMGLMTYVLTALFLHRRTVELDLTEGDQTQSTKWSIKIKRYMSRGHTQQKTDAHEDVNPDNYIYHDAYRAFYSKLSRITRQVWRFLKSCFRYKSSMTLYQAHLKPLLVKYL